MPNTTAAPGDVISLERYRAARRAPDEDPETAWIRGGEQLRELDPKRFASILRVVQEIIAIHLADLESGAPS